MLKKFGVIGLARFLPILLAAVGTLGAVSTAVAQNDEISVASGADPVSLDPRKTWVAQGYSMNAHVFESLAFRKEENGKVQVIPVLAESWKQIDPLRLELKIRQGVKFHNGETLDAAAIKYTLDSIMNPAYVTNLKTWTNDIEKVEAPDAATVLIKTKYQTRGLMNSLAQVPIVAPKAAQELGTEFEKKPIGTGPYRIVSYAPNSAVVIERFDGYWGTKGKPKKITFRIMPENSVRLAALQAGEVQVAENLPPDKLETLRSDKALKVIYTPTLRVDYLVLNARNELLRDVRIREAISLAIDRASLVKNLLGGTTRVANSISPPGTDGYDESLPAYAFNPARAKQLLKEAGYAGQPFTFGAPIGRYSMDKQVNEAMAGMLKNVGINVRFEALAWSSYYPKYNTGGYDIGFIGQTDFTVNPHKHWNSLFYSPVAMTKYKNEEMDKILEAARQELDNAKAAALYKRGQALQHKEFGSLPLYYEPQLIGISAKLQGFEPRLDEYVILTNATLTK